MCETDYLLITNILGILIDQECILSILPKVERDLQWSQQKYYCPQLVVSVALLKATDHFCSSDTINSLRVEVGQNGRGSTMRNREPRAEPARPHTCGTQSTSALCGRRRRWWAVILRLRPLYYDINFGIPGISSCMDQSTILRAHKLSTNI